MKPKTQFINQKESQENSIDIDSDSNTFNQINRPTPKSKSFMNKLNQNLKEYQDDFLNKRIQAEYKQFEDEYKKALALYHKCKISEIRIDQNDGIRAEILENIFNDIVKTYYEYKEDKINQMRLV